MAKPRTRKNRYGEDLKQWETMQASVTTNAAELPQLEIARVKLEGLLEQFRGLLAQQALQTAGKQQTSKQLRTVVNAGRKVITSMVAVLKEHYGHANEKLVEFGVQPLRTRPRKPATEPTPKPTEPASNPTEPSSPAAK